jgi:hypothetical protein
MSHGITPMTVPGATAKNAAEPTTFELGKSLS